MPGFSIEGKSPATVGPSNVSEVRRKHRWTFTVVGVTAPDANKATLYLQKAQRPSVKFEEATMHHDQEEAYFAGKTKWDPIALEFYDAEQDPDVSQFIWEWVNAAVQISEATVAPPSEYKKFGRLEMYDGKGNMTERWKIIHCWPKDTNWNELDYASSDIAMVTVSLRFDRAVRVV